MIQWIITGIILIIAIAVPIYRLIKKSNNKENEKDASCTSCASDECGGCPIIELKKEIEEKKKEN